MNSMDQRDSSNSYGIEPALQKNDRVAKTLIWGSSIIVFAAVTFLSQIKLNVHLGFDPHVFAKINAFINSAVAVLLIAGLVIVKRGAYASHKRVMLFAIVLSILFLLSYICHHLLTGETRFGDLDHNGLISAQEKLLAGNARFVYYILLLTHIPLAGIILPFILFTAYRSLTGEYAKHKKLARITWPIWLYVAITGVIVYIMINPYY
jgi:putative membrane protein